MVASSNICKILRKLFAEDRHCKLCKVELTLPLLGGTNADIGLAGGTRPDVPSIDTIKPRVAQARYEEGNTVSR